jgi:hypothetical protein
MRSFITCSLHHIIGMNRSRRTGRKHGARGMYIYRVLVGRPEGKRAVGTLT